MGLDTLANVKTRLNITTTDDDAFLQAQLDLVSDTIEAYVRRKVLATTFTQHFYREDYRPSHLLELFAYPVQSIASITEDGVTLDPTCYRLHKPTGRVMRTSSAADGYARGSFFYPQVEETIVTYSAGWATCPSPILSALDEIISVRYNKMKSGVDLNFGADVQRVSIPGVISIDFDYKALNNDRSSTFGTILGNTLNALDFYRSHRAILGDSHISYIDEQGEDDP